MLMLSSARSVELASCVALGVACAAMAAAGAMPRDAAAIGQGMPCGG